MTTTAPPRPAPGATPPGAPDASSPRPSQPPAEPGQRPPTFWSTHGQLTCALAAGALLLAAKVTASAAGGGLAVHLLVGAAFALGFYFGAAAAVESIRERKLDINLLMVVGAVLAAAVGAATEGALLLFLFTLSGALEHYALHRTHAAIEGLVKLFPKEAVVLEADGRQRRAPLAELRVGDLVLVKPGEQVTADGEVVDGASAVDESAITGEFLPREKVPGAAVYAGTLNTAGRLVVRVGRPAEDTTLAKIIHLVSQAQEEKAPLERLFDKVGSVYTAAVLAVTVTACLVMGLALGVPWTTAGGRPGAILRAITLLIVASPCALILSTPVVTLSAIASCARRGIILKGGRHLESLAGLKALVFDKTGTLTRGQVRLVGVDLIEPAGEPAAAARAAGQQCAAARGGAADDADVHRQLLQAAMSVEANSTHPLAAAVVRAGREAGAAPLPVDEFVQEAGLGIRGTVAGRACVIGAPALLAGLCPTRTVERLTERIAAAHAAGETAVVLFYAGRAAVLRFCDTLRPEAAAVARALHGLGVRPLVMLTGDHRRVAEAVAARVGLDEVRAELLPGDKLEAVTALVAAHGAVGMVGDGVNDAPALARATVGIAMGGIGSEAAMQAADVVLLSDAVGRLPWLIGTARRARRVMAQNLTFAIGVIVLLMACSLLGIVGLPLGVVGHEGSTLLVVLNGLRLLRGGGPRDVSATDAPLSGPHPPNANPPAA